MTSSRWKQQYAADTLANVRENFPDVDQTVQQPMCLMEEIGELAGELRRYLGWARRPGNLDDLATELADVQIVTFVCAAALGFDLHEELEDWPTRTWFAGWPASMRDLFWSAYRVSNHHVEALSDIVRQTECIARQLNIDLDKAMVNKWEKIFSRGWKSG